MANKDFLGYVAASYPFLWIDTVEYSRAIDALKRQVSKIGHSCYKWDMVSGISDLSKMEDDGTYEVVEASSDDPTQPIQFLEQDENASTIIFVQDYHLYFKSDMVWRRLLNDIDKFKKGSCIFVVVSPIVEIPPEIARYVTVMDFELPDREDLEELLKEICDDMDIKLPEGDKKTEIINCGLGLTTFEFENAIYLSIAKHSEIVPTIIHSQKEQLIRKNATLEVAKQVGGFEGIAGMENLKGFAKKMVGKKGAKGVLLLGVPGGGKSEFSKRLGTETGRMTIAMDFGKMMGSLVGETERKTNEALKVIDTMEPCILFIDEIEKGLAGVSGYNGDSGTSQRQGGQFLKWMNDHTSDVYIVATSNNISKLPPEFLRAERWDAIFFVDLPNKVEREAILDLYKKMFNVTDEDAPNIENWTGAEIKSLCKLASSLEVPLKEAAAYVCPIFKTMEDEIKKLRDWAGTRTVPASKMTLAPTGTEGATTTQKKRTVSKVNE